MTEVMNPFDNDAQVLTTGDLTVENGMETILVTGELTIRRDRSGLQAAQALAATFQAIADRLAAEDLPERATEKEGDGGGVVDNPFR